jgi:hypothetical protein
MYLEPAILSPLHFYKENKCSYPLWRTSVPLPYPGLVQVYL